MILMRLNKVLGVCEIVPYNELSGQLGGWFPIDSLNFGFNPKQLEDGSGGSGNGGGGGSGAGSGSGGGGGAARGRGAGGGGNGAAGGSNDGDFTEMRVSKAVDMATVNLMKLAMESREQQKGKDMGVVADIHFIGSVRMEKKTHTFTFLRIHLDGVELKEWGINGSADERPVENLTLIYEKAAMCYETTDGRLRLPKVQAAWDQTKGQEWKNPQSDFYPDFPKPAG